MTHPILMQMFRILSNFFYLQLK